MAYVVHINAHQQPLLGNNLLVIEGWPSAPLGTSASLDEGLLGSFFNDKNLLQFGFSLPSRSLSLLPAIFVSRHAHDALGVSIVDSELSGGVHDLKASGHHLNELNFLLDSNPLVLAWF